MTNHLEAQIIQLNEALAQANDQNEELLAENIRLCRLCGEGVPDGTRAVVLTHDPQSGLSQLAWAEYENEAQVALALIGALGKIIGDLPCLRGDPG